MDKILTVEDVADILKVKAITVREMFRHKRLRAFKVGKGWRTTETMLREDLDALARGEAPAQLPAPASGGAIASAPPTESPSPSPPAPPVDRLPKVGQPASADAAPSAAAVDNGAPETGEDAAPAKKARAPRAPKPKPEEADETPQQFLF